MNDASEGKLNVAPTTPLHRHSPCSAAVQLRWILCQRIRGRIQWPAPPSAQCQSNDAFIFRAQLRCSKEVDFAPMGGLCTPTAVQCIERGKEIFK